MDKSEQPPGDAPADPGLTEPAAEALRSAAVRLRLDPAELASRLGDGLIADLIEELDLARRLVPYPTDAARITRLLERIHPTRPGQADSADSAPAE